MKKNYLRFLLCLFAFVLFTTNVNAGLVCNPSDEDVTIKEKDITDAGFDAYMPMCKWIPTDEYDPMDGEYDSYDDAYDSGFDLENTLVETYDAKDLINTRVPRCSDDNRKVSASGTCTRTISATYVSEPKSCSSFTSKSSCSRDGCTWNARKNLCIGNYTSSYYTCPAGFTRHGRTCSAVEPYYFEEVSPEQNVRSDAQRKCREGGYNCTCSAPKYTLNCPVYKCERIYKKVSACTPDFEVDGQPAYCVNPSQKFNKGESNYQYDSSFNVLNCASSYSTVDCGYANILIEGAYYNAPDDSINTALRLWSIHSGQVGDEKTGIANLTGENCEEITYFTTDENKKYVNVYKKTHDYIMYVMKDKFYDVAKRYTHIPEEENANTKGVLTGNTFEKITCENIESKRGVMCGDSSEYRIGFELYFNTLIGNKYMKEHLSSLYGGGNGVKPTGATLQSEYSFEEREEDTIKESWIEITFEHESFWNYIEDEEIGCSDAKLRELKNKLLSEGKTESEAEAIINQIRPYCKVKTTIVDEDGNVLVTEQDMEKCIKGTGCRTKKFSFAICDIVENIEKDVEIKVKYERTRSSYSVRKYYSCANANVNQTLFAFFKDESSGESGSETGKPVETERIITEDTYSVTNYKCAGGCQNSSLRTSGDGSCKNDNSNYNGVYTSTVKDPSLKCIVNLNDATDKTKYDYSSYFGVNTNFCRVYCSDEVEYVLADKVKAISGRSFNYNIEFAAKGSKKLDYNLTSVVKEKRSCVSEIYYNHLENLDVIRNDYGLTEDEFKELKKSKTFAGLFNVLKKKASNENEREEILNQIIYDIYNCNFYSKKDIKDAGVDIPQNYKTTASDKINKIHDDSNNYGLGSDKNGNKTGVNKATVEYEFGAKIKDTDTKVKNVSNASTFTGKLSKISYCKDETGNLCYGYDSANDETSYNYPSNRAGELKTYTLFKGKNIKVPTNDFARFEVTAEINYYNNNKYQVDYGSGEVFLGNTNADLMTLANYSYPIDKNAYNLNACKTSIEDGKYHRCTVNQFLNPLTFYRNDNAYKLTINDKNQFKCYVDVEMPTLHCDPSKKNCNISNGTIYRNVDPANLFPSGNLKENSNWSTEKGLKAKEDIESSSDELKTDEKYLDYSITITPSQIKNIKEYNETNSNYVDELIYNCDKDPVDGIYYNCNSYFMDLLRGNVTEYSNGTYGNINADRK